MIGVKTIESALNITPAISSQMENAIFLWDKMYKNQAPWLHEPDEFNPERIVSLGLPSMIASEKARMVLLEFKSEITTPTEEVEVENPNYSEEPQKDAFGNDLPNLEKPTVIEEKPVSDTGRAEFLSKNYQKLLKAIRRQLEYGIAKGGLVIKPYLTIVSAEDETGNPIQNVEMDFDFIQADDFYPLAFDANGNITEAAFVQTKTVGKIIYRRLEYHKWENGYVTVINKAYKASSGVSSADLGQEIPLTTVPEWTSLEPTITIGIVDKPLFAYFRMPEANTIDTVSPLGVSGYSRAVQLIKDADMQYSRLLWEYEAGEMAIDIDRDALRFEDDGRGLGHSVVNRLQQRLFRKVDLGNMDTYQPYAPSLRDANYIEGLNTILMRIEDVCAISRGTLSDGADVARTATELKILKQRSYQANKDIQDSLENTLNDVVYIMNAYCDLYELPYEGEYDVSFEWDDSIITDADSELNKYITLRDRGLMSDVEVRMRYFGETERQAEEALLKIREQSLEDARLNMDMEE